MTASHNADTNHDSHPILSWKTNKFMWIILMVLFTAGVVVPLFALVMAIWRLTFGFTIC